MAHPTFHDVYAGPEAHWDFLTAERDSAFEGQHFDRKEAGRPDGGGTLAKNKFRKLWGLVEETLSAF